MRIVMLCFLLTFLYLPAVRSQEVLEIEKFPLQELPLGDSILLFLHPAHWDSPSLPKGDYQPSSYESWFELLNSKLSDEYFFEKGLRSIYPKELIIELFRTKSDGFIDFSKITGTRGYGDSIVIYSNKIHCNKADIYSIMFYVDTDCNNCEYGMTLLARAVISIKNQEIADIKLVDFVYGNYLSRSIRFCYFPDEIIYIKNFGDDETGTVFLGLEQYQVNEHGKFIRYYEQDGYFENEWEKGVVRNHTRDGQWEDMNTMYVIESEYAEGLPVGRWKYYKIEQDYDDDGYVILSSRKKGELLTTETYEVTIK